jgi:hypothetical protein
MPETNHEFFADLERKRDLLGGWVKETQRRSEELPYVQQGLEIANFQIEALKSLPSDAPQSLKVEIKKEFLKNSPYWEKALTEPLSPQFSSLSGVAFEVSSSNVAIQRIQSISVTCPTITNWANTVAADYGRIEGRYVTEAKISQSLVGVFGARETEFRDANQCFDRMIAKIDSQDAWGIKMRTFVDHLKGDLFDVAQKLAKKQKVKWADFAAELALGGVGSPEYQSLLDEDSVYHDIKEKLSRLAKKERIMSDDELRMLRTRIFDFVFSVLSVTDMKKLRHLS